ATTVSYVSGTPGGMFAPTMFIGAMLGGAVGTVERSFFPNLTGSVATYALVGIGVLFAGFLRAPITSVFMALEVSGDYSIILPVLVANMLSYLIARQLQEVPIFEVINRQDGIHLPALEEQREQESLLVEDAMRTPGGQELERLQSLLAERTIPHLYSDQDLDVALRYAQQWPLVPVVSRTNISRIQGVIDLAAVLSAYRK
ncbi:MAG: chloride channel protein, partial [Verrucomicrobia bacterium]|nr:chloride channel protein [Verrucomicrobiota bacterium]